MCSPHSPSPDCIFIKLENGVHRRPAPWEGGCEGLTWYCLQAVHRDNLLPLAHLDVESPGTSGQHLIWAARGFYWPQTRTYTYCAPTKCDCRESAAAAKDAGCISGGGTWARGGSGMFSSWPGRMSGMWSLSSARPREALPPHDQAARRVCHLLCWLIWQCDKCRTLIPPCKQAACTN